MKPIILNLIASRSHYRKDNKDLFCKTMNGSTKNFFDIAKTFCSKGKKSFLFPDTTRFEEVPPKKGNHLYLESLRKGLLTKGKPLGCVYLNAKDFPLLKKMLYHCGLKKAEVERFINDLSENNIGGEISLFQFFLKLNELMPVMTADCQTSSMETTANPDIDFMLRSFGLTPNEVNDIFYTARVEGGGMDVDRLIKNLKERVDSTGRQEQVTIDESLWRQMTGEFEQTGIQTKNKGQSFQISMDGFISALENMNGRSIRKNRMPPNVKATIAQLLEKVVIIDERNKPVAPLLIPSDPRFTDPFDKETISSTSKPVEKAGGIFPLRTKVTLLENENRSTPVPKSVVADLGERFNIPLSERNSIHVHNQEQEPESLYHNKTVPSFFDDSHHPKRPAFSSPTPTINLNARPENDTLPAYLIDQIGRQLSRSILRGDRVVKLKINPPDLGLLKVDIDIKANILKLGMITENQTVKELLLSNIQELRESLGEQGVKLERIDIQLNHDFRQSQPDSEERSNNGQREGRRLNDGILVSENNKDGQLISNLSEMIDDHLLNIVI
jgi:hypothetical protein